MKYALIIGSSNAGKSTTMAAVCEQLKPTRVLRLISVNDGFKEVPNTEIILNGTYLIEVYGLLILVVAGATTEQNITITILISVCIKFKIQIHFALVSMRSFEKRIGFNTKEEIKKLGTCVLEEKIYKIEDEDFKETKEWKSRIAKIVDLVNDSF